MKTKGEKSNRAVRQARYSEEAHVYANDVQQHLPRANLKVRQAVRSAAVEFKIRGSTAGPGCTVF